MRIQYPILFPVILSFAIFPSGCGNKHDDEEGGDGARKDALVSVRTAPVTTGNAFSVVMSAGKTEAIRKQKLYSPIAGRVTTLKVLEGTIVKAGEVMATILSKESQAALAGAQGLLRAATTEQQRTEAARTMELARASERSLSVSAAFDGVVAERSVSEGELVAENAELLTIVDLSSIVFRAEIPLRDLERVRPGAAATIRFASLRGRAFNGEVDAILPQSDAQSQTVAVRIRFPHVPTADRPDLRTDVAGVAEIVVDKHAGALFVPKSALLRDDERNTFSVVTVNEDSVAIIVPVTVGVSSDSTVEVHSPLLHAGLSVIVEGNYALADSTRVIPTPRSVQ